MTYQAPLPNTGAILPVLGSGQAWEGSVYNGNLSGIDSAIGSDRARLTTIEGKIGNNALIPRGTSTARDGLYGVPSTAAGRVALANSAPYWFNTDAGKGYTQQYFAQEGDAGAGIFTRTAAGWYAAVDSGRIPLSGFTVANSGGAITRDGAGVIVSGACTSVSLKSLFTQDFRFYDFELELVGAALIDILWRASTAGVDNSSPNYNRQRTLTTGTGAVTGAGQTGQTGGWAGHLDSAQGGAIDLTIQNPADATKRTSAKASGYDAGNLAETNGSLLNVLAAHDGITLFCTTNSFSGLIRVYGRNPF